MNTKQVILIVFAIFQLLIFPVKGIETQSMTTTVYSSEYRITGNPENQRIEMDGYDHLGIPGKPELPSKCFHIALPPGAKILSVDVQEQNPVTLTGDYKIRPAPPITPLVEADRYPKLLQRFSAEWQKNRDSIYSSDLKFPQKPGWLVMNGSLRKYVYASVEYCPFAYYPLSGLLTYFGSAEITIQYETSEKGSDEWLNIQKTKHDTLFDDRAEALFINYRQIKNLYEPLKTTTDNRFERFEYIIITTDDLVDLIGSSDFVTWKHNLNYNIKIITITDPEITEQAGVDIQEQIRNFLRGNYLAWETKYVLIIGHHDSVPMRYCYPDPSNHLNCAGHPDQATQGGDVPTDYYYADLSSPDNVSWDSDGDGFHGEYIDDTPDFLADVFVGRIPTDIPGRITYTLDKLVSYEQDTGTWKNSALHGGAFWYLTNEDHNGKPAYDGACCLNEMENDLMQDWTISHYSEQGGLEKSAYDWPALTETAFTTDWLTGQYGVVNWGAHGWTDGAARKYWATDDGDGVPENSGGEIVWPRFIRTQSNIDDDYPCIFFAISCVINYPENNNWGNFGIDLLTEPGWGASVGAAACTRVAYGSSGWPENPGGSESVCYEFNRYFIDGPTGPEKIGEALFDAHAYIINNYSKNHFTDYWTAYNVVLFGDPSLVREGISETPTPRPTATPEPTATPTFACNDLGVELWMPAQHFEPGDTCACKTYLCNPDAVVYEGIPLFAVLDVFGELFFAPSFSDFDYYTIDLEPGLSTLTILSAFIWPDNTGSVNGIFWYAGMLNSEFNDLFGQYDVWEFGWSD